jgi:hypothetical protein
VVGLSGPSGQFSAATTAKAIRVKMRRNLVLKIPSGIEEEE